MQETFSRCILSVYCFRIVAANNTRGTITQRRSTFKGGPEADGRYYQRFAQICYNTFISKDCEDMPLNTLPDVAVSTAWNALRHTSGTAMAEEFLALGIDRLELDVHTTVEMIEEIERLVKEGKVRISSLHNYCPMPATTERAKAASAQIDLANPIADKRLKAVAQTKNTIEWAARLGAKVVVVHLGRVDVELRQKEALSLIIKGKRDQAADIIFDDLSLRGCRRAPFIEAAVESLRELVPVAEDSGVKIGLETRYYYAEIPSLDEFRMFFGNIRSSALGYWHDVGHADTMEALGIAKQEDYLSKYSEKLLGMHIHDAEVGDDHQALGLGKIDFTRLRSFIKPHTNLVMEIHRQATVDELVASRNAIISMLSSAG